MTSKWKGDEFKNYHELRISIDSTYALKEIRQLPSRKSCRDTLTSKFLIFQSQVSRQVSIPRSQLLRQISQMAS